MKLDIIFVLSVKYQHAFKCTIRLQIVHCSFVLDVFLWSELMDELQALFAVSHPLF